MKSENIYNVMIKAYNSHLVGVVQLHRTHQTAPKGANFCNYGEKQETTRGGGSPVCDGGGGRPHAGAFLVRLADYWQGVPKPDAAHPHPKPIAIT